MYDVCDITKVITFAIYSPWECRQLMSGTESNDLTKQESLIFVTKKLGSAVHAQDGFAPRRGEVHTANSHQEYTFFSKSHFPSLDSA